MYIPTHFRIEDRRQVHDMISVCGLSNLVTTTLNGLIATPLPLFLAEDEGEHGVLYGHVAKANPQWQAAPSGEAMVIFMGPDAYVSPSWYATKRETGKVVPTWNYAAVHAYGPVEFFEDSERLLDVVTRLTNLRERSRAEPWAVNDAPAAFTQAQLRAIVGVRLPITRLEGKLKMSQNRSKADRAGVASGLAGGESPEERLVATLIPID